MVWNWTWIRETGNSSSATSNLCYTYSTILPGEGWQANPSTTHNPMLKKDDRTADHAGQCNNRSYASRKIRVKADLPVGKNLQEHWSVILAFELSDEIMPFTKKQVDKSNIMQYISSKTDKPISRSRGKSEHPPFRGVLGSLQGIVVSALLDQNDTKGTNEYPDYQLYFWEGHTSLVKDQLRIKPEVLRIDADKTLRLSVAFPLYRIVPVRGSKVSVGVGKRETTPNDFCGWRLKEARLELKEEHHL
ncbi:GMC_oxred_C domain-containing protein [Trichonephila clavipes]|nr:GMC_oxred_C domain-containing protein [Trichonephila clavipes]